VIDDDLRSDTENAAEYCSARGQKDRRSGKDRRVRDIGPPDGVERRHRPDPRRPVVKEQELSEAEWERYFGNGRD
jgi:hypothetical protein